MGGFLHYLDDFLFIGQVGSHSCLDSLNTFFQICDCFEIPIVHEKTVFPSPIIEFLGITIDSSLMEFRLPKEKLHRMRLMISLFLSKRKVLLKEAPSLLGLFAFAARIIPVARIFSRRFALATKGLKNLYSHVCISASVKEEFGILFFVICLATIFYG